MNNREWRRCSSDLLFIAKNLDSAADLDRRNVARLHLIMSEGNAFGLAEEALERYESAMATLLDKGGMHAKFSSSFLERRVNAVVIRLQGNPTAQEANRELDDLIQEHESFSQENEVTVPLSGLDTPDRPLKLGRVTIHAFTADDATSLQSKIDKVIDSTPHSDDMKEQFKRSVAGDISSLVGQVVAEYSVVAEPTRALERATEETRRALDLLRFSIPSIYSSGERIQVGLMHEVYGGRLISPVVASAADSFSWKSTLVGPLGRFEISAETIKTMEEIGLFVVSDWLCKPRMTELEAAIVRAIHWFGGMTEGGEPENRLLSGIVCLETLFTRLGGEPISNHVAESVVFLLAKHPRNGKLLKERVKAFYRKRSDVAHGSRTVVSDAEVDQLMHIAASVIARSIVHASNHPTLESLDDWFENVKFAALSDAASI